jgi:SpoVK/Ycf46/Vps4 family AAA+-type ATPase
MNRNRYLCHATKIHPTTYLDCLGKTKLAQAIAGEAEAAFLSIGPGDVLSKFVGESEASVRGIFERARKEASGMESKCAVLFFDEIDALGQARDQGGGREQGGDSSSRRVLAELLLQLNRISNPPRDEEAADPLVDDDSERDGNPWDGGRSHVRIGEGNNETSPSYPSPLAEPRSIAPVRVIVVAATNRPDDCDPALLRRFGIRVHLGLPTAVDRRRILKRLLEKVSHDISQAQLRDLANDLKDWSGSDLESLAREATMAPVRECLKAAARTKRPARGRSCSERLERKEPITGGADQHKQARDCLLAGLQSMRKVSLSDFKAAIAFWNGNQDEKNHSSRAVRSMTEHYDSCSSSEGEED